MASPAIIFFKQILIKHDHNKCQFCGYGGQGKVIWRIEFVGDGYRYHWLACNKCRFRLFLAFGRKRINRNKDWKELCKKPAQDISSKGAKSSRYWALSLDRREALDRGETVSQYERKMFVEMDLKRTVEKKDKDKQEHIKCKYELSPDKTGLPICGHKGVKEAPFNMPCNQQNCPWSARQHNKKWWKNHSGKMGSFPESNKKKIRNYGLI